MSNWHVLVEVTNGVVNSDKQRVQSYFVYGVAKSEEIKWLDLVTETYKEHFSELHVCPKEYVRSRVVPVMPFGSNTYDLFIDDASGKFCVWVLSLRVKLIKADIYDI